MASILVDWGDLTALTPLIERRREFLDAWRQVCASELGGTLDIEDKDFDGAFESELARLADPEVGRSSARVDAALQATAACLARRGVPLSHLLALSACGAAAAQDLLGDELTPDMLKSLNTLQALRAKVYARAYREYGENDRGRCGQPLVPLRRNGTDAAGGRPILVGRSPALQRAREAAELAAKSRRDVLITGEDGAGKETLARLIHELAGEERSAFVPVNCAGLPTNLAQSELFGHARNGAGQEYAGLFRAASRGTLFLREITELSPEVQAKLVRVLDERMIRPVAASSDVPIDVRVVASTSRDIESVIARGELRSDLLGKLRSSTIHIAPLRERSEDIAPLVEHFLTTFCHRRCGCIWGVSQRALDVLLAAHWPANVRELRNAIEHAVTTGEGGLIEARDLPSYLGRSAEASPSREANASDLPSLAEAETQLIRTTLGHFGGNKVRAAMSLGISRHKLYDRLRKLGIQ
ncbi:MAG: sigma-54-dependent Fis family transcriptional regulator [Myxococcales bacterium]|nr:sigma-54-dependent Fis family transcriptional regulator [Myxococcales bacterium]